VERLKEENAELRYQKEVKERDHLNLAFENNTLLSKLENLENIFIGMPIQRQTSDLESLNSDQISTSVPSEDYRNSQVTYASTCAKSS
jgi:hypothetical protein